MLIEASSGGYDCILLDVDNGPEGLTRRCNDWLYSAAGLVAARNALRPEGLLAIWSAGHDDRFAGRLARSEFSVRVIEARHDAHWQGEDDIEAHVIFLAHKIP